MKVISEMHRAH